MKRTAILNLGVSLLLISGSAYAQGPMSNSDAPIPREASSSNCAKIGLLTQRRAALNSSIAVMSPMQASLSADWVREIDGEIESLKSGCKSYETAGVLKSFDQPDFKLSVPIQGATNEVAQLQLAWTEDHPCPSATCPPITSSYTIQGFIVEI